LEQAPLDAGAVNRCDVDALAVEAGQDLFDSFEQLLRLDFAPGPFVVRAELVSYGFAEFESGDFG